MSEVHDASAGSTAVARTAAGGVATERAIVYRNQAIKLSLAARFAESEVCSREALRLAPHNVDILNELGVAVWRQGRPAEAEEIYHAARRIKPDDFRILVNLGLALAEQGRMDEAIASYRRALEIQPDSFDGQMALGVALSQQGRFAEAMDWLAGAVKLRPDSPEALQNAGMNLARQQQLDPAIDYFERALQERPEFAEVHRNLAYALLSRGDYIRGWPEHEWRLKCPDYQGLRINRPVWNGDDLHGRTILLHGDQGYGDILQFIRYAPLVKSRGAQVMVLCPAALLRLLARCPGVDLAFDGSSYFPDCHVHAPLLSLPAILGTTLANLPAEVPYLHVDLALKDHWRSELARAGELNGIEGQRRTECKPGASSNPFLIGISWQGNPAQGGDRWRSFPLRQLAPFAELANVRLISLQTVDGLDQLGALDGRFAVTELANRRGRDFHETAAIVSHLDLIITPESAVAHLAGGLGARVWVALSTLGDWRWLTAREDSPWYPTMRLFRQSELGDWPGVFRRMADALRPEAALRLSRTN